MTNRTQLIVDLLKSARQDFDYAWHLAQTDETRREIISLDVDTFNLIEELEGEEEAEE